MMKTIKPEEINAEQVEFNGSVIPGVTIRWLITKSDGAKRFAMRYFELEKGTVIPEHHHLWEHEIFVLKGKGEITVNNVKKEVSEGTAIFIEPDAPHAYKNIGEDRLVFLCLIPYLKSE
jgi:quercetin dioxygenase-like cupin family protein